MSRRATRRAPIERHSRRGRPLQDQPFATRLAEVGIRHLFRFDPPRERGIRDLFWFNPPQDNENGDSTCTIHLGTLQRMNLHQLQKELVDIVEEIIEDNEATARQMAKVTNLMAEYST
jgi:hypothetical protein